jgi:hypothetical protein
VFSVNAVTSIKNPGYLATLRKRLLIPSPRKDWLESNAKQTAGMRSKHYEQAKNIARDLNKVLGQNKKLEFAGDSLAGAMATTAVLLQEDQRLLQTQQESAPILWELLPVKKPINWLIIITLRKI